MRILLLNSARKFIGEAAHCLALAGELRAAGHHAYLGLRKGCEPAERARATGIPVLEFTFNSGFHPFLDLRDIRRLRRTIRSEKIDVIHCHRGKDHWIAAAALSLPIFNSRSKPPILVRTRHVVVPMKSHWLNRLLLTRRTDALIAVSSAAAASMNSLGHTVTSRIVVIPSAVDIERFSPERRSEDFRRELGVSSSETLIALVARLQRIKGQEVFIAAAARLASEFPAAKFLIAGRGTDEHFARLRGLVEEAGIAERIVFRGWVESIETLLASADISVVASLGSEGSSRVGLESMASGVPLVATTVGALPELVVDGETGILTPPKDPAAMVAALRRLLESPDLRSSLAKRALEQVRDSRTLDRWTTQIVAVYEQALNRSRR